ncbi:MAG: APC family permease [Rubrobacter sp.]|nr:APC family permease [Rubrobacter sp.]MDQ3638168.1 amino acid transporter [Actinomycetota bacterium]
MSSGRTQPQGSLVRWLLAGRPERAEGPYDRGPQVRKHSWWQVTCLTGVDYFSTLGYQPGIAVLAAGVLSPIATLLIVLLTLFGALPMYRRVAQESPHGQGSIAMLEHLLSFWKGKLFVLALLGFVATDFIITITLSAADATAHIVENPFVSELLNGQEIAVTLVLVGLLGAVFLKGFREAIGIAVALVAVFLLLNLVVLAVGLYATVTEPQNVVDWTGLLLSDYANPFRMLAAAAIAFPALALGLSGFETGVTVMPLVRGAEGDSEERPVGRVRNTRKLLTTAALIMSFYLLVSSFITVVLIPMGEFEDGGSANGRALAYIAHEYLGEWFGTAYDISTIAILWFAGASAMAGLLNVVPRYLPRYGMAPDWTRAVRPLVVIYTIIAFTITIIFRADVDAQSGAYATGVLVLMTSAAFAVTLSSRRRGSRSRTIVFGLIFLVFAYTLVANVIERPDGIKIASFFIGAIVITSLVSRVSRTTELRTERIEVDETAQRFIDKAATGRGEIHIVAHRPRAGDEREYARKEKEQREDHRIQAAVPILFLEVDVEDPSEFEDVLEVRGVEVGGYKVLEAESSTVPNAIAALLIHLRDTTGKTPHCYFGWTQGNPIIYMFRYLLFGEGDTAPVTHEVLREAEPDAEKRPAVHVGGR